MYSSRTTPPTAAQYRPNFGSGSQPDISYHPNEAKYHACTARRLAENPSLPNVSLPGGFPSQVEGPIVWDGKDWNSEGQWVYQLSDLELKDIDAALEHFKGLWQSNMHNQTKICICSLSELS